MVSIFKTQCIFSPPASSERRGGERAKNREQHMISTWECRNSEFISRDTLKESNCGEGGRQAGSARGAQKERESKKRRKRNRGREGGRGRREKGKSKKRPRESERERGVKEQTLHVAVEGMICLWRGTNSQVGATLCAFRLL